MPLREWLYRYSDWHSRTSNKFDEFRRWFGVLLFAVLGIVVTIRSLRKWDFGDFPFAIIAFALATYLWRRQLPYELESEEADRQARQAARAARAQAAASSSESAKQ